MFYLAIHGEYRRCKRLGLEQLLSGIDLSTFRILDAMHLTFTELVASSSPVNGATTGLGGVDG